MQQLEALLAAEYGFAGTLTRLPGENRNDVLQTRSDARYVLKVAGSTVSSAVFDLEHRALEHVENAKLDSRR